LDVEEEERGRLDCRCRRRRSPWLSSFGGGRIFLVGEGRPEFLVVAGKEEAKKIAEDGDEGEAKQSQGSLSRPARSGNLRSRHYRQPTRSLVVVVKVVKEWD
jgi:hypothetical protein